MDEDFRQEHEQDSTELKNFNSSSLPPRSTLHNLKETEDSGESKIIQLLLGSFFFIVIIAAILLFLFNHEKDNIDALNTEQNQTQGTEQSNNQSSDDSQIEVPDSDSTLTTDQSQEEINSNDEEVSDENKPNDESDSESNSLVTDENKTYVVQSGENLYRISIKFYETGEYYEALAIYNNLENVDAIYAGLKLEIPPKEKLQ